jgi:purine-nucleoside/S-methyl-5'-thioadenosine phosphorylase / adenosine deaminase
MTEVPLPGAFEWVGCAWGRALRCRPLGDVAPHLFTTRVPVLTDRPPVPGDGWHLIARELGVPPRAIVRLRQVHGAGVVVIRQGEPRWTGSSAWGTGDISVSNDPGVVLCAQVADCTPVLIADRRSGAAAAVHAGWRGTAQGAGAAAVAALRAEFGVDPGYLIAAIGPSIGPCCYRVGAEVRDAFEAAGRWGAALDAWFSDAPAGTALHGIPGADHSLAGARPSVFLDTWEANADQLARAGVPEAQIHVARVCTSCRRDIFHSYRVDGARTGRMAALIRAGAAGR